MDQEDPRADEDKFFDEKIFKLLLTLYTPIFGLNLTAINPIFELNLTDEPINIKRINLKEIAEIGELYDKYLDLFNKLQVSMVGLNEDTLVNVQTNWGNITLLLQ